MSGGADVMTAGQADFLFTLTLIVGVVILAGLLGLIVFSQLLERRSRGTRAAAAADAHEPRQPARTSMTDGPVDRTPTKPIDVQPALGIYPDLPDDYLLLGAPLITDPVTGMDLTLRRWLTTHHELRRDVWADVVTSFYNRAALDPDIADYFADVDMFELQRHFLAALMAVTGEGLTAGTVRRLHDKHRNVRNTRGMLITGNVYDKTVDTLLAVIDEALRQTRLRDTTSVLSRIQRMALLLREHLVYARDAGR